MSQIIQANYSGQAVQFTADGWFCATTAAEKYGRAPNDWLRLPETARYLEALERKYGKIPYLKTKRGQNGGTWLHPKLAVRFAQWLDMDFAVWCDEQIDVLIRGQPKSDDWSSARLAAASNHKLVCDMVNLHRQAIGKSSAAHHYVNEVRLINWAYSGQFSPIDRDTLTVPELRLLELLERQDAVLLGAGKSYTERKSALQAFANEQRQRLAIPANDSGQLSA
ncbi:DNA-binding protein [Chromobacterium vaccinii]|uniref:KilA-N domain-containing protein n=1 Tax=Chromobacterium vaccinii TaxID=1108595 RepID=UPI000CE95A0C|nr:KilA-N domain-containing protein [Chromobacterium vaccinii]AVG14539.1 DNA-binding protein [Chromobacterium vaccinii]